MKNGKSLNPWFFRSKAEDVLQHLNEVKSGLEFSFAYARR